MVENIKERFSSDKALMSHIIRKLAFFAFAKIKDADQLP